MGRAAYHGAAGLAVVGLGLACGLAAAVLSRLELRGGALQLQTTGEIWLLCVFTTGALAVLLGLSAAIGGWPGPATLRDRLEAWLGEAGETDAPAAGVRGEPGGRFGPWVMEVGGGLLGLYLLGWLLGTGG